MHDGVLGRAGEGSASEEPAVGGDSERSEGRAGEGSVSDEPAVGGDSERSERSEPTKKTAKAPHPGGLRCGPPPEQHRRVPLASHDTGPRFPADEAGVNDCYEAA
jgi:hypothetical protein